MSSELTNLPSISTFYSHKQEEKSPSERCLSPVLNTKNLDRKNIYKRMKGRMKSRVNLSNRFLPPTSENSVDLNKTISELQEIDVKDTTTRLMKIKELEEAKKKLLEGLYVQQNNPEVKPDDFNFKKPFAPILDRQKSRILMDEIVPKKQNQIEEVTPAIHLQKDHFQGFRTGSGKNIAISPELITKHSKVFEGVLSVDDEFVDGIQQSVALKEKELGDNIQQSLNKTYSKIKEGKNSVNTDLFFMHASLSDTQMIAAADIIESEINITTKDLSMICEERAEDSSAINPSSNKNNILALSCGNFSKNLSCTKAKIVDDNDISSENEEHERFCGFPTSEYEQTMQIHYTLNNIIEIIDNTSRDCKHFLEEENIELPSSKRFKFDTEILPKISENDCSNFKRKPLNKSLNTDENFIESLLKSSDKSIRFPTKLQENCNKIGEAVINQDLIPLNQNHEICNSGFMTASKKPIKMQPDALNNAKKLFESCESDFLNEKDNFQSKIINNVNSRGFSTAGGQRLKISPSALQKASCLFADENLSLDGLKNFTSGFTTGSGAQIDISKAAMKKNEFLFKQNELNSPELTQPAKDNEKNLAKGLQRPEVKPFGNTSLEAFSKNEENIPSGFTTGSGANINVSKSAMKKSEYLFKEDDSLEMTKPARNDANNLSKHLQRSLVNTKMSNTSLEACSKNENIHSGFTTGSGAKIDISKEALQKSEFLFKDNSNSELNENKKLAVSSNGNILPKGFVTAGGKFLEISNGALSKAKALFTGDEFSLTAALNQDTEGKAGEDEENTSSDSFKHSTVISKEEERRKEAIESKKEVFKSGSLSSPKLDSPFRPRRKLGISACKQLRISDQKLQLAKSFFEEDISSLDNSITPNKMHGLTTLKEDLSHLNTRNKSANSISTPNKIMPRIHSSTPLKESPVLQGPVNTSTPLKESVSEKSRQVKFESLGNTNLTPVKRLCAEKTQDVVTEDENLRIIFKEGSESNIEERLEKLDEEYKRLAKQMKLVEERKVLLMNQQDIIKTNNPVHRRPKTCFLTIKKQFGKKIPLVEFCKDLKPAYSSTTSRKLRVISPQNAEEVHFNCDSEQQSIETQDGAVIVPNLNNLVGLSEISTAFEAMPGVDPTLLPRGWICNHFKWIVWKLASLERSFPDVFPECLCVENVVQQLKHRYDREIDKAERPALRRILEKDDVPQKRMVLCVSDIIKVSTVIFELEVTDGWYSIRALIDSSLCNEIIKGKLVIGTKLIVQYAEILNCDGCHPLEVPNHVKLKINYNCTRRAAWHVKLGYQRIAEPFPISLNTVHTDGGLIACAKVHIIRAHPLKYMERLAGRRIWRNVKAEEKRVQEWMREKMSQVEQLQRRVEEDYFKETHMDVDSQFNEDCRISEISCAKTLCSILENAKDPEGLKREMTSSQMESVMQYKANLNSHHQQEISARISRDMMKLKKEERDVVSVLQLRIGDISGIFKKFYLFTIWKPSGEQVELLKEGHSFTIYNILPRANGDLTATARTHFKFNPTIPPEFLEMKRFLIPIDASSFKRPLFDEFDTVGTVVQIHVHLDQELWLAGSCGSLLHIKIRESPNHCCLLDNLNRGDHIAVMNLIFCSHEGSFLEAVANACTVMTTYPRQSFLQAGLSTHISSLPQDLDSLLNECDQKIEEYLKTKQMSVTKSSYVFDESFEESTLVSSRLTTTDVAMSLMNIDQFFENV